MSEIIVAKIYSFLQEKQAEDIDHITDDLLGIVDGMQEAVRHALIRQAFITKAEGSPVRLSSMGKCARNICYELKGVKGTPLQPRAKITFLFGDIVEAMAVALAKASGVDLHDEQKEVTRLGVKGHIDGIITHAGEEYLFECKSMSAFSFDRFKATGVDDGWGYMTQMQAYMDALGISKGVMLAVNKNTGEMHEHVVNASEKFLEKFSENLFAIHEFEKSGTLPDRPYKAEAETYYSKPTGLFKLPVNCSYCPRNMTCWEDRQIELVLKKGKPVYYVSDEDGKKKTTPL